MDTLRTDHPAWQHAAPPLVLASGSTTRLGQLEAAGLHFTVDVPGVAEDAIKRRVREAEGSAAEAALALSEAKARLVSKRMPDAVVIGADQILTCDGRWYDKPASLEHAMAQLRALRGRAQILHTAVTLMRGGELLWQHLAEPVLTMRDFSDEVLAHYLHLEGLAVLSSVGACRIEGPGQMLFRSIEGEHAAILGLPMLALLAALRRLGVLVD